MAGTPITTVGQVEAIRATRARETEHLDFKATYWKAEDKRPAAQEAGKDVAAFLNALGGTIVVGVGEGPGNDGVANGLCNVDDPAQRGADLVQQLRATLVPSGAAEYATPVPLVVEGKGVLAVNVRPWPYGVVGVRWGGSGEAYRFPVRQGAQTVDLAWEEVVMRNDAASRRTYLRLKELVDLGPNASIRFESSVAVQAGTTRVPVDPPPGFRHGWIQSLDDGGLTVMIDMNPDGHPKTDHDIAFLAVWAGLPQSPASKIYNDVVKEYLRPRMAHGQRALPVRIPMEAVEMFWTSPPLTGRTPLGHIALSVDIVHEGYMWVVRLRP